MKSCRLMLPQENMLISKVRFLNKVKAKAVEMKSRLKEEEGALFRQPISIPF